MGLVGVVMDVVDFSRADGVFHTAIQSVLANHLSGGGPAQDRRVGRTTAEGRHPSLNDKGFISLAGRRLRHRSFGHRE